MKIWCYEDAHNWGAMLARAAQARGHEAHMFDEPRKPDQGYVFMHMHHHPQVRLLHKRMMAIMAMNPSLVLVPEYRSSNLYDDKIEQARQLSKWMPRTQIYYSPGAAKRALALGLKFPLISKTSEGASSHNVRLVSSEDEARREIKEAFSDLGIKCRYGQVQRGYLLWQEFVEGNEGDIRIIAIGRKRLILRRYNRKDRPMASGSGNLKPIVDLSDPEILSALETANQFFRDEDFRWCGIDLIKEKSTGRWLVLETTVGWTLHGYYECAFIDCSAPEPRVMEENGMSVWDVFLDEVEAGIFD